MVGAVGDRVEIVLIDFSHTARHRTIAQVPTEREAVETEAFPRYFIQISAQIFNTNNAISKQDLMAWLPSTPAAYLLKLSELIIVCLCPCTSIYVNLSNSAWASIPNCSIYSSVMGLPDAPRRFMRVIPLLPIALCGDGPTPACPLRHT